MSMLLDIGNSRLKWAYLGDEGLSAGGAYAYQSQQERGAEIARYVAQLNTAGQRVWVANVLGSDVEGAIGALAEARAWPAPRFVKTPAAGGGIRVAYAQPHRLGVDRYLAMVGARQAYAGPLIVIDCGTAVTVDALTAQGEHLGGLIFPGAKLMLASLHGGTQGVRFEGAGGRAVFGHDTETAVHSGVLHLLAGGIDRIVEAMRTGMGTAPTLVLTGGDGQALEPFLKDRYHYEPQLVLKGLAYLAQGEPCESLSSSSCS